MSSRVQAELERLYDDTIRTDPAVRASARQQGQVDDGHAEFYHSMRQAYMPVTPQFGRLLYLMVRSARIKTIVEFGTSFGISSIFLAAALRDNGGGRLITTEFEAQKATQAKLNLATAGLDDLVEIRVGDAMQTLRNLSPDSVDLLFLDGAKPLYLSLLKLLEPTLRKGALLASDNVDMSSAQPYVDYVRNPVNGYFNASFSTAALGAYHGHELLMRL